MHHTTGDGTWDRFLGVPHRIWNSSSAPVRYLDADVPARAAYAKLAPAQQAKRDGGEPAWVTLYAAVWLVRHHIAERRAERHW
jgi:hypothetical protein